MAGKEELRQNKHGRGALYLVIDENGMIEKVMPKVKPDTNAAEILDYLRRNG